jgi:HlyD family secretion protein
MSKKKRKFLYIIPILLIIFFLIFLFTKKEDNDQYTTVLASSGPLAQTVIETGVVKPVKEVDLNFLSSGRLENINVKVGDRVEAGQILAELDNSSLEIRKLEAEAGLKIAQANLSKILAGVDKETIDISQRNLDQAKAAQISAQKEVDRLKLSIEESLRQAEEVLFKLESNDSKNITLEEQAIISAEISLDNAKNINFKNINHSRNSAIFTFQDKILVALIAMDNINTLLEDDNAKNVLSAKNSAWLSKARNGRLLAIDLLNKAIQANDLAEIEKDNDLTILAGEASQLALSRSRQVLSDAYFMLENTITSSSFPQSSLDSYKSIINNQLAQINLAVNSVESVIQNFQTALLNYETNILSAEENLRKTELALDQAILLARNNLSSLRLSSDQQLNSALSKLDNAKQTVAVAEAQLASIVSPVKQQDINLARAQVSQAEANVASVVKQIEDSQLFSPLDGVVTVVNYSKGEQFMPSSLPFISLLVDNVFEIEVDVSESDINKIKIGDQVKISLDAFGDDLVFSGEVYFIEPAQTIIQGVVYYKVKIKFTSLEDWLSENSQMRSEIKVGMTANLEITTAYRDKVISVPARAIIQKDDNQRIVRLLVNEQLIEVVVKLGLRGDDGLVEIIEGIKEGDEIITFIKTN